MKDYTTIPNFALLPLKIRLFDRRVFKSEYIYIYIYFLNIQKWTHLTHCWRRSVHFLSLSISSFFISLLFASRFVFLFFLQVRLVIYSSPFGDSSFVDAKCMRFVMKAFRYFSPSFFLLEERVQWLF